MNKFAREFTIYLLTTVNMIACIINGTDQRVCGHARIRMWACIVHMRMFLRARTCAPVDMCVTVYMRT